MIDSPCKYCGACCMTQSYPPFPGAITYDDSASLDFDWMQLKRERPDLAANMLLAIKTGKVMPETPCLWLDLTTMQCKHYAYRPEICRDFEAGSEYCDGWRGRFGLTPLTIGATS